MNHREWTVVGMVVAALVLGMPLIRWLVVKSGASPEVARKAVHMGMGLGCAALPWLFDRPLPVWILAACATVPLLIVRLVPAMKAGIGSVLHGVGRVSYGDILFAPAVAAVFHLSKGDHYLHFIPIVILTLADAAGALGGTRWGKRRYGAGEGFKTVEGSVIFLVVAFLCISLPLLLGNRVPPTSVIWISLILATLAMMGEGLSDRGFDNLVLPLGCYYVLERIIDLETAPLVIRFVVLVALLGLVLTGSRWSSLSGGALLGSALLGYGCAVIADWRFALPPAAVFICHVVKTRKHDLSGVFHHRLDAVVSHAIASMPWVIAVGGGHLPLLQGLAGISFAMATQLSILDTATRCWLPGVDCNPIRSSLKGWLIAALPGLVWFWPEFSTLALPALVALLGTFLITRFYQEIHPRYSVHPVLLWSVKGLLALISSIPALFIR